MDQGSADCCNDVSELDTMELCSERYGGHGTCPMSAIADAQCVKVKSCCGVNSMIIGMTWSYLIVVDL